MLSQFVAPVPTQALVGTAGPAVLLPTFWQLSLRTTGFRKR